MVFQADITEVWNLDIQTQMTWLEHEVFIGNGKRQVEGEGQSGY